jgi:hypothetical protein
VLARRGRLLRPHRPRVAARDLDRHDRLGSRRERRAGHHAHGLARGERRRRRVAGRDEPRALPERSGNGLRDAHGVAVHRGRVERRPVHVARDVPGRDAAECLRERDALDRAGRTGAADDLERFGDADHPAILKSGRW